MMEKEKNNKVGNEAQEKTGNGAAKTVISATLGTVGGFEATAANLEAEEESIEAFKYDGTYVPDAGHQVSILGRVAEVGENGNEVGVVYAQDEEGRNIKLIDTNNDDVADVQCVDTNNDEQVTEDEILNIEGQGISLSNPSLDLLAENLNMFEQDSTLPDYYNQADVSSML